MDNAGASVAVDLNAVSFHVATKGGDELSIVDGMSLRVHTGEFLAIVGPSGCGKSTILNLIAGLLPVTSGSITFGARSSADMRLGYMFQTDALLPWRSVLDNVSLGLELQGMPKRERHAQAKSMLCQLGLSAFAQHLTSELSGGMRQRVALARMWVLNPALLLMDEPFGALDAQTRLIVQDLFLSYWEREKSTVLLVTHDIEEAILLADRVVVFSGRPASIKSEHQVSLPRPRNRREMHHLSEFSDLWDRIWNELRSDAQRALETV